MHEPEYAFDSESNLQWLPSGDGTGVRQPNYATQEQPNPHFWSKFLAPTLAVDPQIPSLALTLIDRARRDDTPPQAVDDDESSSEKEDTSDTNYVAPRRKTRATTTKRATTPVAAKTRSSRRLTEAQKEDNKRKRDEDKSMLVELRSFLEKSTEKQQSEQQSVQQQIQSTQTDMSDMQVRASQADYVVYLTQTVAQQQQMISNMNLELFNMGARHRVEQAEQDLKRREERDALEDKIFLLQEQETILHHKAEEWRTARDAMMRELLEMRNSATTTTTTPTASVESEPAKKKLRLVKPGSSVKQEEVELLPVVKACDDESLYSWRAVTENNARCVDIYGFTAPQLTVLLTMMNNGGGGVRAKSGSKATFGEQQFFLMFLYYFTHYTTLTIMHRKFGISPTSMRRALATMLESGSRDLFAQSRPIEPSVGYVHGAYFFRVEAPLDTSMAASLFDPDRRCSGVHLHCMHDSRSHKVIAYQVLMSRSADAEWLAKYEPRVNDALLTAEYERRMRGKFAIASSRFRGLLKEFGHVAGTLLALTNIDLGHENPIVTRETLTL